MTFITRLVLLLIAYCFDGTLFLIINLLFIINSLSLFVCFPCYLTHMYVHVCRYVCKYVYCMDLYWCVYARVYIYACVCQYVCMYIWIYVCIYMCIYLPVCFCLYVWVTSNVYWHASRVASACSLIVCHMHVCVFLFETCLLTHSKPFSTFRPVRSFWNQSLHSYVCLVHWWVSTREEKSDACEIDQHLFGAFQEWKRSDVAMSFRHRSWINLFLKWILSWYLG